jgi:hypothetical protein
VFPLRGKICGKLKFEAILSLDVEALTKQNGVRLLRKLKKKFKKKVKTDLPYLSFYKKKPETHTYFFFGLIYTIFEIYITVVKSHPLKKTVTPDCPEAYIHPSLHCHQIHKHNAILWLLRLGDI